MSYNNISNLLKSVFKPPTLSKVDTSQETDKGIYINGKKFEFISGPVGMYYLKPPVPRKGQNDMPLILLFSDVHFSRNNMCKQGNSVTTLSSTNKDKFLKQLDILASDVPIDFFTETSVFQKKYPFDIDEGPLSYDMNNTIKYCGPKGLSSSYLSYISCKNKCPTKNIRWHDADVRFMEEKGIENQLSIVQTALFYLRNSVIIKGFKKYDSANSFMSFLQNMNIKVKIDHQFLETLVFDIIFDPNRTVENKIAILVYLRGFMCDKYGYESLVCKQYHKSKLYEWLPLDRIFDIIIENKLNSDLNSDIKYFLNIIQIELQKEKNTGVTVPEFDWIRKYIKYIINPSKYQPPIDIEIGKMGIFDIGLLTQFISYIEEIIMLVNGISLDLYTLFRMFKTPEGDVPGTLCIGYFGHAHVGMMYEILTSVFNYKMIYAHDPAYINETVERERCLKINKNIYLEDDVREHYYFQKYIRSLPNSIDVEKIKYDLSSVLKKFNDYLKIPKATRKSKKSIKKKTKKNIKKR